MKKTVSLSLFGTSELNSEGCCSFWVNRKKRVTVSPVESSWTRRSHVNSKVGGNWLKLEWKGGRNTGDKECAREVADSNDNVVTKIFKKEWFVCAIEWIKTCEPKGLTWMIKASFMHHAFALSHENLNKVCEQVNEKMIYTWWSPQIRHECTVTVKPSFLILQILPKEMETLR